ncbi:MAG: alpha/beta fold hydrolase [Chitinivibrionales bacterium]|nr:alpha/beta fold hydrolase [Chitinivibrionales bacterium]
MSRFLVILLSFITLFVPREKYERKVAQIVDMDQKHAGWNFQGWEYKSVSKPGSDFIHRYYEYPSPNDSAPVFLFFHGLILDGRTFTNMTSLADSWRLIAYDIPESTSRYMGSMKDFVEITSEFVELMHFTSCNVCGVSFGGGIALRLAADKIVDVKNLVLISTGIVGNTRREQRRQHIMAEWVKDIPDYKLYWFMEKVYKRTAKEYEDDTTGIKQLFRVKDVDFFRQVVQAMDGYDAGAYAKKVSCPVLLLSGSEEDVFSDKQVKRIKKYIPQAQSEIIEGGTHAMVFRQGDNVAGEIREFCSSHGSTASPK